MVIAGRVVRLEKFTTPALGIPGKPRDNQENIESQNVGWIQQRECPEFRATAGSAPPPEGAGARSGRQAVADPGYLQQRSGM